MRQGETTKNINAVLFYRSFLLHLLTETSVEIVKIVQPVEIRTLPTYSSIVLTYIKLRIVAGTKNMKNSSVLYKQGCIYSLTAKAN